MDEQRFGQDVPERHARIERCGRILEYDLQLAACRA